MIDTEAVCSSAAQVLRKAKAKANREKHELPFLAQIRALKLPEPRREYRFAAIAVGWDTEDPKNNKGTILRTRLTRAGLRDWRLDFAWPEHLMAVEVEGAPGRGRHTSAKGFKEDCVKYNEALILGWHVVRVTGDMVGSGKAINTLIRTFKAFGIITSADPQTR